MNYKILIIPVLLLALSVLSACDQKNTEQLLSFKFAKSNYRVAFKKKKKVRPPALKLMHEGVALHKSKRFKKALFKFEKALNLYSDPEIYYHYGNSLSSLGKHKHAIKAYSIAVYLEYGRSDLALYNTACSYSLLRDKSNSFTYLEKAVLTGYPNIKYLEKEKDLEFLRSLPSWKVKYKKLTELYIKGNSNLPAGKTLSHTYASSEEYYHFCDDGKVKLETPTSSIKNDTRFGKWRFVNNNILINWHTSSGRMPVGEPINCPYPCDEYRDYKPFENNISIKEKISWHKISNHKNWSIYKYNGICE